MGRVYPHYLSHETAATIKNPHRAVTDHPNTRTSAKMKKLELKLLGTFNYFMVCKES
jgi:hypothetical protein